MSGGVAHQGWAIALVLALIASGLTAFALPAKPRAGASPAMWDISRVAQTFMPIVGALAGFSVASTIFIANLTVTRHAAQFPSLIGMFVMAFVIFVGAAQEFGMTPNLPSDGDRHYEQLRRFAYLLSMFGYFVALAVSWNALRILLIALNLDSVAEAFTWVLLFAVLAGTVRLAVQHLYMLTTLPRSSCLAIPLISWSLAAVFRFALVPMVPALAAPPNEPFMVTVGCFGVAALCFGMQTACLSLNDSVTFRMALARFGDRTVMGLLAMVSTVVAVLWTVVALA